MNETSLIHELKQCPITGDTESTKYIQFGDIPLVNNLCNTKDESLKAAKYPLSLQYFHGSKLTSLTHVVNPNTLFGGDYLYKSGVNKPYFEHCKALGEYIIDNFSNTFPNSNFIKIVDIGGNDGTLLEAMGEVFYDAELINIEPSKNLSEISANKDITTYNEFFNSTTASRNSIGRAHIITSTNVFQHLENIEDFVIGVSKILYKEGIWVLEFPYWLNSLNTNQFDQIYHEHIYYYNVTPLNLLFQKHELEIVWIQELGIHGGSLRLFIQRKQKKYSTFNWKLEMYLNKESEVNLKTYKKWVKKIPNSLSEFKKDYDMLAYHNKIWAFGAAAKECVFLNLAGITDIPYVIDDTEIKQGKFIPGTESMIVSREQLKHNPPDYIIILAHNFADYIIESLRPIYKGKFIVFLPEYKIIE